MDQTEVARYRALLREQSQAKSARFPLSRWLGVDRSNPAEPHRADAPAASPDTVDRSPGLTVPVPPLDGAPTFPARRPLPPLDPALSSAFEAHAASVRRERIVRAPTSSSPVAPVPLDPAAASAEEPDVAPPTLALEPQVSPPQVPTQAPLRLDPAGDFVEPPPLGILDLLSPEMIAEFDLERPTPASARTFGRREGDAASEPAAAAVPVVAQIAPLEREAVVEVEPPPELEVAASNPASPPPALCATLHGGAGDQSPPLSPSPPGKAHAQLTEGAEGETLVDAPEITALLADVDPQPIAETSEDPEASHVQDPPATLAAATLDAVVVPIASASRVRPPLVRRLEPERTPAAVMRNLQTILEAERSIVELWRSLGRAAA